VFHIRPPITALPKCWLSEITQKFSNFEKTPKPGLYLIEIYKKNQVPQGGTVTKQNILKIPFFIRMIFIFS